MPSDWDTQNPHPIPNTFNLNIFKIMGTLKIHSTQQRIKVGDHRGEDMYIMKVNHYSTMTANQIIEFASQNSYLPTGILRACWEALGQAISQWALEGHIVEIPGIGRIRAEVRAKAQKYAEDVSPQDVTRRRMLFTPASSIKRALYNSTLNITCFNKTGKAVHHLDAKQVTPPNE